MLDGGITKRPNLFHFVMVKPTHYVMRAIRFSG